MTELLSLLDELVSSTLFYMNEPSKSPEVNEYESPEEYRSMLLDNVAVIGAVKTSLRQMCECGGAPISMIFMGKYQFSEY